MAMIALQRPNLSRRWRYGARGHRKLQRTSPFWTMVSSARKGKDCLGEPKKVSLALAEIKKLSPSNIIVDSLQVGVGKDAAELGQFVAREARIYEEYWTAAWLRAESHWEDREHERDAENNRRKFAQQEFNAMTRRYNANLGENCKCIVMVKKEDHTGIKCTILNSDIVGTLDLSIKHFSHGETFPGERLKHPLFWLMERKASICYAYVANLCVAKLARRQGVARTMLQYAITTANAINGAEKVFIHVHRHNKPALNLYQNIGFQVVEAASFQLAAEQTYLLCLQVSSYAGQFN